MNLLGLNIIQYLKSISWYGGLFEFYAYGKFPVDCPWQKSQIEGKKEFIQKTFQTIAAFIPNTFEKLLTNCQDIYALLEGNKWFLIYAINENTFLCGGEPTNTPSLSVYAISNGWELPTELKTFYSVHNGFGAGLPLGIFLSSSCVLPNYKLETLNSLLKNETDFEFVIDPKDLLQFYPNGLGDAQCFYRLRNGELTTVDWDHETREIYRPENFWSFVDRNLSELI